MIEFITENYEAFIDIAAKVIAVCAAIAVVTPSRWDNDLLTKVSGFINVLGFNVGRARNSDDQ
tara:strand:- start:2090 stop:2278 length:189 start_codon:yes stop_codon:yes gene_type:complete